LSRKFILLAEDNVEMADRLEFLLSQDYEVEVVHDGSALIAAANRRAPDVIVSDIVMPGMSGLDAARQVLAVLPGARILFVSIRDEPAVIRKAFSEGAAGYVVKSDAGEELMSAVETVFRGDRFVSSAAGLALSRSRLPSARRDI